MRQIEFRAWNGESMHYGGFSVHATGSIESTVFVGDIIDVMQFTGLHDKNGVKIFEGDILEDDRVPYEKGNHTRSLIVFLNGEFQIEYRHGNGYLHDRISTALHERIVGNIHQNPELLEK